MPCYPSDLTDEQWAVLEPRAREVMRELTVAVGRPMIHDLRAMCDAVSYVVKNGVEWRALPADFPPWEAVYAFWERWNGRGLPLELGEKQELLEMRAEDNRQEFLVRWLKGFLPQLERRVRIRRRAGGNGHGLN